MSYPPPPYQMPPMPPGGPYSTDYYYGGDPLAPAKRASVMMFVVGAMILLLGMCAGVFVAALPEMMKHPELAERLSQTPNFSVERAQHSGTLNAGIMLALGVVIIVLGAMV